jgi:hypothetical protein
MYNSTVDFYVSVGVRALQEMNRESALNTAFNPECTEYRKSVFPGLSSFMRDVFAAERFKTITYNERISILSEVKDESISKIVSLRNQSVVAKPVVKVRSNEITRSIDVTELVSLRHGLKEAEAELAEMTNLANEALDYADKYLAEIAELKAANASLKGSLISSKETINILETKLTRLETAISKVRSVNLNGVITKVAVFTGIKQSV